MPPTTYLPIISSPGGYLTRAGIHNYLSYVAALRDKWIWEFHILNDALLIYQQMAAGREWRVSGSVRGVSRCVEWINSTETRTYDGVVNEGYEDYLRRTVLDSIIVGRTLTYINPPDPIEYLDPTVVVYKPNDRLWYNRFNNTDYKEEHVVVHHPVPIGGSGAFISPIANLIPTANLAWLLRQHDQAALDGRKMRDMIVVGSREMAQSIADAIEKLAQLWSGTADVSKIGIPIVYTEMTGSSGKVEDMISRLGISQIPATFDRAGFQFEYVNEISGALGLSLRHFWNSEQATNRALEETQEARQQQKGPSTFVRTEQRKMNGRDRLRYFGPRTRFEFIEEVDVQSRLTNAQVLKLHAESAGLLNGINPQAVNIRSLMGWLQTEGVIPPDIELLNEVIPEVAQDQMTDSDGVNSADGEGGVNIQEGVSTPTTVGKTMELDYDEVSMDRNGHIVDRRRFGILFERGLKREAIPAQAEEKTAITLDFDTVLSEARAAAHERFKSMVAVTNVAALQTGVPVEVIERLVSAKTSELESDELRLVGHLVSVLEEDFDDSDGGDG